MAGNKSNSFSSFEILMKIFSSLFLLFGSSMAFADPTSLAELKFRKFIPAQHSLFEFIEGDLNKDGVNDAVLIIKKIDKSNWVTHNLSGKKVDRNRRGIIVLINKNGKYKELTQNLTAFSSENDDGGVYFAPELSFEIKKNILEVNYSHGRYGYWGYKFRVDGNNMQLIGYDLSSNHGPYTDYQTSINFISQKKLFRKNVNLVDRDQPEVFEDTWSTIHYQPIYLSKIKDFDRLNFD